MKFLNIILLVSIFIMPISAKEAYKRILITKTVKKSSLKAIKSKLTRLKVKMIVKKSKSKYIIYSGKYRSTKSAQKALKRIKRYFPSAQIIADKKRNIKPIQKAENTSDFFIGFAPGMGKVQDSDLSASFAIEGGYIYNKNIFVSLAYLNSSTSDTDVGNIYASLNYKINLSKNTDFYVGVLGGYSTLELTGFASSVASTSMLIGLQTGLIYNLSYNFAIFTAYQGISIDHIINLSDTQSEKFSLIHNMQLGIQYKF